MHQQTFRHVILVVHERVAPASTVAEPQCFEMQHLVAKTIYQRRSLEIVK